MVDKDLISVVGKIPSIVSCNPMNLAPGVYNFTVVDINNCIKDTFVEIFEPQQNITFDLDITNASCGGGLGSICINNIDGAESSIRYHMV